MFYHCWICILGFRLEEERVFPLPISPICEQLPKGSSWIDLTIVKGSLITTHEILHSKTRCAANLIHPEVQMYKLKDDEELNEINVIIQLWKIMFFSYWCTMNLLYFLLKGMKLPMLVIKAISCNKAAIVPANSNNSRT